MFKTLMKQWNFMQHNNFNETGQLHVSFSL